MKDSVDQHVNVMLNLPYDRAISSNWNKFLSLSATEHVLYGIMSNTVFM